MFHSQRIAQLGNMVKSETDSYCVKLSRSTVNCSMVSVENFIFFWKNSTNSFLCSIWNEFEIRFRRTSIDSKLYKMTEVQCITPLEILDLTGNKSNAPLQIATKIFV